jgi:hypothetical protein
MGCCATAPRNRCDDLVKMFADKIPKTYGAPVREAVASW